MTDPAPPGPDIPLPAGWGLVLDPATRVVDGGTVVIGGAPLRVLRLTANGAQVMAAWVAGASVGPDVAGRRLARRLVDAGVAHPRPRMPTSAGDAPSEGQTQPGPARVTIVVPVRDRARGLEETLEGIGPAGPPVIVVDDGSTTAEAAKTAALAARFGARLIRRDVSGGPAAARNAGWRDARTELVAFLDADCRPVAGWLDVLVPLFDDPALAAAAPRIRAFAAPGTSSLLDAYELDRSPLDRGPREGPVRPRGRVPFVPSAALVVRRATLDALGGFDASMAVGEDVDLVWRIIAAGRSVRYEPRAEVGHPARTSWGAWLRQRVSYGSSAAALHDRHGPSVAPLAVSRWSAAAWGLALAGHPGAGVAVAGVTTALLPAKLGPLHHPWKEAARLALPGHAWAGRGIADAMRRAWWPALLVTSITFRRVRRASVAAATLPLLVEWVMERPSIDPIRWVGVRLADDVAYGAGVWLGCVRHRRFGALRPDLSDWPGKAGRANGLSRSLGDPAPPLPARDPR